MSKPLSESAIRRQNSVVARWEASGLSQAEFCRQEGIPEWSLSEWKRRKRNRDAQRKRRAKEKGNARGIEFGAASESAVLDESNHAIGRSGIGVQAFVPVIPQLSSGLEQAPHSVRKRIVAEIVLPGGAQMEVLSGADIDTLRNLLRALMECGW